MEERRKNSRVCQEERCKYAEKVAFCFTTMYFGQKIEVKCRSFSKNQLEAHVQCKSVYFAEIKI